MSFNRKDYNDGNWLNKNRQNQNLSGLRFAFDYFIRPWIKKWVTFTQILDAHIAQLILIAGEAPEMTCSYHSECSEEKIKKLHWVLARGKTPLDWEGYRDDTQWDLLLYKKLQNMVLVGNFLKPHVYPCYEVLCY